MHCKTATHHAVMVQYVIAFPEDSSHFTQTAETIQYLCDHYVNVNSHEACLARIHSVSRVNDTSSVCWCIAHCRHTDTNEHFGEQRERAVTEVWTRCNAADICSCSIVIS